MLNLAQWKCAEASTKSAQVTPDEHWWKKRQRLYRSRFLNDRNIFKCLHNNHFRDFFDIWERASQIGIGVARDVFDNRVLVTSYKLI